MQTVIRELMWPAASAGDLYGLKKGSFAIRMNDASVAADELMRQSASLLMSNQITHLMKG